MKIFFSIFISVIVTVEDAILQVQMNASVFTKIVKGELPCHKVYEDDKTLAFMDIHPVTPGMVVVVTKQQVANFEDLDDETYVALWSAVKKVAKKLKGSFPDAKKIAVRVEGFDIPDHTHVKLFPLITGRELEVHPDFSAEPDHEALAAMAERLAS